METIRYAEKKKSTKWPAIIISIFLIAGGAFVAYGIKFEDNPKMLGFQNANAYTDVNALEEVETTDEEKLEKIKNINYEIKEVTSADNTVKNYVSDIHLPNLYVDGKELTELNAKINEEYTTRFENLKNTVSDKAESNYSFNVSYKFYDNIVGLRKVVSIVVEQKIVDEDADKVTSNKVTTYNVDLASKKTITQADILVDILGKDYKDIIKEQVENYVVSNNLIAQSKYTYEITYLENFYIKDNVFHIVFNMDSDPIVEEGSKGVLDIAINKED